jgi:ATP-dependent Lon protease
MTNESEQQERGSMSDSPKTLKLPVLPLKNVVLFPKLVLPLSVGRDASRAAVEAAIKQHDGELILMSQRSPEVDVPGEADLYTFGTHARIRKVLRTSQNLVEIVVSGLERVGILSIDASGPYLVAEGQPMPLVHDHSTEEKALQAALFELAA